MGKIKNITKLQRKPTSNRTTAHLHPSPHSLHHNATRTSTNATIPNRHLNSNNPPHPLQNLRLPPISIKQNIERGLQRTFFFLRALKAIPLDSVEQLGQFHQFHEVFLQDGQSRICREERFGRASGFADEEFEEGELGCEEEGVVV